MRGATVLAFGLVVARVVPGMAQTQAALPPGTSSLDPVVKELRLLRQVIDKQNATTARVQLLVGRLGLQDQRTARAQQAVERLKGELVNGVRERDEMGSRARAIAQRLESATPDEARQLEVEARMLRARLADSQAQLSSVEARLVQAKQALDVETGRYDELDGWLRELDKQLQGSGS